MQVDFKAPVGQVELSFSGPRSDFSDYGWMMDALRTPGRDGHGDGLPGSSQLRQSQIVRQPLWLDGHGRAFRQQRNAKREAAEERQPDDKVPIARPVDIDLYRSLIRHIF